MDNFPRTIVDGVSLPRLIIGTNWLLGYSHTSPAKDRFIKQFQTRASMTAIMTVFLERGINAIMAPLSQELEYAIRDAEDATGVEMIRILTPSFAISPGGSPEEQPEFVLDQTRDMGATFCLPHQCVTDALIDRREQAIRDIYHYTKLIRERGMIPGLSTHMPEAIIYADKQEADIQTYIQLYNAVGLAFVWSTLRNCDMVTIGTTTPDEAREVIDLSLDLIHNQAPVAPLQKTRSKASLTY